MSQDQPIIIESKGPRPLIYKLTNQEPKLYLACTPRGQYFSA
jgi:hypothetical protein